MTNLNILSCEDLRALTGYQRAADVERCLRDQGIRVFRGKMGPWTTMDLVNHAGGISPTKNDETYNPDAIL